MIPNAWHWRQRRNPRVAASGATPPSNTSLGRASAPSGPSTDASEVGLAELDHQVDGIVIEAAYKAQMLYLADPSRGSSSLTFDGI
jgi:hypothetical protein